MTVTSWAGLPSCWEDAVVPSDDYVSLLLLLLTPWSSSPIPAPSFSPLGLHQEPSPASSPISPRSQPFQLLGPHQELLLPCSFSYLASFTDLLTVGSSRVTWSLITQLPCRQPALIWSPFFPHFFWKLHGQAPFWNLGALCLNRNSAPKFPTTSNLYCTKFPRLLLGFSKFLSPPHIFNIWSLDNSDRETEANMLKQEAVISLAFNVARNRTQKDRRSCIRCRRSLEWERCFRWTAAAEVD